MRKLEVLPERRRECLFHINEWFGVFEDLNRGPFVREIAEMMNISDSVARHHIEYLIAQELLYRPRRKGSGVWLTEVGMGMFE